MSDAATPGINERHATPSLRHATVADAMHTGVVSCPVDTTLTDVARLMASHHVHCVVVMGSSQDDGAELVWGLISDLDLMRAGMRLGSEETAGALALEPVISVPPTMSLVSAGELMLGNGVSHVVVVDPETKGPTGILSTLDIAGVLAQSEG